jgi:hypothetical protein
MLDTRFESTPMNCTVNVIFTKPGYIYTLFNVCQLPALKTAPKDTIHELITIVEMR